MMMGTTTTMDINRDNERLDRLQGRMRADLLSTGEIRRLEGLQLHEDIVRGEVVRWHYSAKLKNPTATVTYTMNNEDGAAIYRDGVQLGTA